MSDLSTTIEQTIARLTAAGAPFERVPVTVGGRTLQAYRNAFPDLRALVEAGRAHGDKPFIDAEGATWSFTRLFAEADALAAAMQHHWGLQPGDRVAIAMRNRPEWAVAFVATVLCGAVPAPLNSFGTRDDLVAALEDVEPRGWLCDAERMARVEGHGLVARLQARVVDTVGWAEWTTAASPEARPQPVAVRPEDPALLLFTSGASSRAKAVLSSHRAVCQAMFNIDFIGAFSVATSPEVLQRLMARGLAPATLTAVPLFHVSGLHAQLLSSLRHGRRLVFMRRWNAAEAVGLIRQHRITQFNGAPAMVAQLLAEPGFDDLAATTLGGVGFGGAGLSRRLMDDVTARMKGSMSGIGFGMTETNGVGAAVSGRLFEANPDASGVVSPIVEVSIQDEEGQALPAGERGEVCLRGVSLMDGYWRQPEATAEATRGGWLHTGDVGYLDADGLLHVVDRLKDIINRSGEKIVAAEVESCLLQHPEVLEAAVVSVPDDRTGEAVAAQVVVRVGSTVGEAGLQAHAAARLAAYKVPTRWRIGNDPMLRNPAGKLLKAAVRQAFNPPAACSHPGNPA